MRRAPRCDVDLVFTTREEIGCQGAQYYARRTDAEAIVALEVVPVAKEYAIEPGAEPVMIRADCYAGRWTTRSPASWPTRPRRRA